MRKDRKIILLLLLALLTWACARKVSPTGGPKDEDPPVPLESRPVNYSTDFKGKNIIIKFDEYVKLNNIQQELLVSPPVKEKPELKLRGKAVVIDINNDLKDSTTYNINFYEGLSDNNEGNLLPNFQFEFSTGPTFDSLYVGGEVLNAFDYTTEKGIFVLLYRTLNDSLPRTTMPDYIAKTDEEGHFWVTNLKPGAYFAFAVKDLNYNQLFDLPNEPFAFSTKSFSPDFVEHTHVDTFQILDTVLSTIKDTVYRDSIASFNHWVTTVDTLRLFLFTEDFEKQYLRSDFRKERQQVIFAFNRELDSNILVSPLSTYDSSKNWFIQERFETNDSLVYWITDSLLYNKDSIELKVQYTMLDSNELPYLRQDTMLMVYKEPKKKDEKEKGSKKKFSLFDQEGEDEVKEDTVVPSPLTIAHTIKGKLDLNVYPEFDARFPIKAINKDYITFSKKQDTLEVPVSCTFLVDTMEIRKVHMLFEMEEGTSYKLVVDSGAFVDYYGNTNDSIGVSFTTKTMEDYGKVTLLLKNVKEHSAVQLLSKKEEVLYEHFIEGDTTIVFDFLKEATCRFKLYYDSNDNKKWDTGNFKELLQPEQIFYFEQDIDAKANWEMEYEWDLYPIKEIHSEHHHASDSTNVDSDIPGID